MTVPIIAKLANCPASNSPNLCKKSFNPVNNPPNKSESTNF